MDQQQPAPVIDFETFLHVDVRAGTIVDAQPFPQARRPAIRLEIDFGETIGRRKSSAQITQLYAPADLIGRQVVAVVNFPPKQIGPMRSEVLVLGVSDDDGRISLLSPDHPVPNGARMH